MPEADADPARIRDAATVVLVRRTIDGPSVLMGQRSTGAAFMPSKFVFPGGAVDPSDANVPFCARLPDACMHRLANGGQDMSHTLAAAAIRELQEETGLILARPGRWPGAAPTGWHYFHKAHLIPDASGLRFVFRAITPPGRTRRFDARFFLADAAHVHGDPTDMSRASGELSCLAWVPLDEARHLDLPFITTIVLAEVAAALSSGNSTGPVPFFDNAGDRPAFRRLA